MQISEPTIDIPKNPAMRREWIKYQLRLRGYSVRAFADLIGVSNQAVWNALWRPSSHIHKELADLLGIPVRKLFPEYYDEDGRLIVNTRPPKRIRQPLKSHRSKGRVA